MALIIPSILSADFARLGAQVAEAQAAGADRVQVDVMDGRFVPNITVGPLVVAAVRRNTTLPIEAPHAISKWMVASMQRQRRRSCARGPTRSSPGRRSMATKRASPPRSIACAWRRDSLSL